MTPDGQLIKSVDPVAENWLRLIELNDTTAVITYSTVETRPPWHQDKPVAIALTTALGLQAGETTLANAEFSLSIDGDWKFDDPTNTLDVDLIVRGVFHDFDDCGKTRQYRVQHGSEQDVYHFGSDASTAASVTIVRQCLADSVTREVGTRTPVFFDNNTAVNITMRFPSFNSSLYYDPNFALLLGFTGSRSCNSLLAWILPASFIAGAAAIILLVIVSSFIWQPANGNQTKVKSGTPASLSFQSRSDVGGGSP